MPRETFKVMRRSAQTTSNKLEIFQAVMAAEPSKIRQAIADFERGYGVTSTHDHDW